ncbi:MAG TPA: iron-sulfur cluster assembly accessory protein [Symbiobacteriaceae bacterium]|nr:iron-sulfur cluster assembly accessory protein [Symbiobacteriaceae bacterium]
MNVSLTDKASAKLKDIIKSKGENLSLRVMVRSGGCSGLEYGMALERNPRPDDSVAEQDGVKVVIDPNSLKFLDGSTIDYVDSLMGGGFTVNNPNATSSCGCGQSFQTADQKGQAKSCGSGGCSH